MIDKPGNSTMSEHEERGGAEHGSTRRQALRRFWITGVLATASAGLSELFMLPRAAAATLPSTQLPIATVLAALGDDAPAGLRDAIASGCCVHFYRDEGACSPACGTGYCCYTTDGCYVSGPSCISVSCSRGNFSTGC